MRCELLPPLTISNALLGKKNSKKKSFFSLFFTFFTPQELLDQPQLSRCFARFWVGPSLMYSLFFFWNCCEQGEIQLSLFLSFPLPRLSHYLSVSVFEEVTCLNLFHEIRSYLLFVDEQILLGS